MNRERVITEIQALGVPGADGGDMWVVSAAVAVLTVISGDDGLFSICLCVMILLLEETSGAVNYQLFQICCRSNLRLPQAIWW
jgi:hypothetical protein